MIEIEAKLRHWGNSLGITIPKDTVSDLNLKSGEDVKIFFTKSSDVLKKTFGTLKIKKPTQILMEEIDKELYNE
ncbi:hypothetical protein COV11_01475 [Candidatus Woesearchaeota archaeon CG10_big_fil_rev_8_21_14_0_10_30_7]|nr:MAG: hypothetical protein COV11_01475 [Candidatus Woesearchaeota archaeon CG10_big_fil_rev_8_21_14_0_10_30_7]